MTGATNRRQETRPRRTRGSGFDLRTSVSRFKCLVISRDGKTCRSSIALITRPLHGVLDQFMGVLERQLLLDVGLVSLHGFHTKVQFFGDLARRVTPPDKLEDLQFSVCQFIDRRLFCGRRTAHALLQDFLGDLFADINFSAKQAAHGLLAPFRLLPAS